MRGWVERSCSAAAAAHIDRHVCKERVKVHREGAVRTPEKLLTNAPLASPVSTFKALVAGGHRENSWRFTPFGSTSFRRGLKMWSSHAGACLTTAFSKAERLNPNPERRRGGSVWER